MKLVTNMFNETNNGHHVWINKYHPYILVMFKNKKIPLI